MVFLHLKGPDVCSADRKPLAKRRFFERIDQEQVAELGGLGDSESEVRRIPNHVVEIGL